jgi:HEAT repeat protein
MDKAMHNRFHQPTNIGKLFIFILIAFSLGFSACSSNQSKPGVQSAANLPVVASVQPQLTPSLEVDSSDPLSISLVDLLSQDPFIRQDAAIKLGQSHDPRAIEALMSAMQKDTDEGVLWSISAALESIGVPAVDALIKALQDSNARVRIQAANILWRIPDARSVEPLIAALKDTDPLVAGSAATALGSSADARGREALIVALLDPRPEVSGRALEALQGFNDPRALSAIIQALKDPNLKTSAKYILEGIKDEHIVAPLIEALHDDDPHFRANVSSLLSGLTSLATEGLSAALSDENVNVRRDVAYDLTLYADERAMEGLIRALKDDDATVRGSAASALERAVGSTNPDPRAIENLIALLNDPNSHVADMAQRTLGIMGPSAVEPLLVAVKDPNSAVRARAARVLGSIGDVRAVEGLLLALKDQDAQVRLGAVYGLLGINDPRAMQPFSAALKNNDLKFIAEAYVFYIVRGIEGSEAALTKALNHYGSKKMAEDYLNCGNSTLADVARDWAQTHGYQITQVQSSAGGPVWGRRRSP